MTAFSSGICQTKLAAYSIAQWNNLAFRANPAAGTNGSENGISFLSRSNYLIPELGYCMFLGNFESAGIHWAGSFEHAGWSNMTQDNLSLYAARSLGETISIGSALELGRSRFKGYVPLMEVQAGLGVMLSLSNACRGGLYIKNLIHWSRKEYEVKEPTLCAFGIGYDVSEKLNLNLSIDQQPARQIYVQFAWSYAYGKNSTWQAGFSASKSCFLGWGTRLSGFRFMLLMQYQNLLGCTPEFSMMM